MMGSNFYQGMGERLVVIERRVSVCVRSICLSVDLHGPIWVTILFEHLYGEMKDDVTHRIRAWWISCLNIQKNFYEEWD